MSTSDHSEEPRVDAAAVGDGAMENQDVPEDDGIVQPGDSLETDDMEADPLDTGISPPERNPYSERFGVTVAEAREGENLDQRLAQEEPDVPPVEPEGEAEPRAGRLVAADEGAHPVGQEQPRQLARDVGVDGAAASAEEAAVHVLPEDESGQTGPGDRLPDA
jgi:hypothetical protein